ncbi:DAK2 domain fusion YloV family protein [Candidatus Phytoplasma oryzae]|uniref:DAK2 domain fusion YloV family protein n=1 Tax=Candidatus Phytoplasma oryzae TaxID=203274 RepID=A0A139JQK5_9MOLU|nr:DAK2 domain-containing protein [Candidatus Phytoplasma oryzae]KXT29249.1 DAK2 domain fusion YloV family protein [Candidatus Phytoplasma oryzae]KXT29347.1 DAK2 domain fusion YloV family protein [Candidatus Phytoplasma oryzae]RAM57901.1 hypothetical protein DH96_01155 [Candidatus Phytoplasma oryzae]
MEMIEKHKTIDGNLFKKMFIKGTINLKNKYQEINNLNVFPIPDGDTGTNMQLTMMKGVEKLKKIKDKSIIKVTKVLSDALLFGSKGNSGVILSQFFSGIYDKINKLQKKNINISEFIDSLAYGYQKAYNSVIKPVEGTILTVLRESIEKTIKIKTKLKTIKETLQKLFQYAKISLENTPTLLPILKKSNVVDSGGAGFVSFLEGIVLYLDNNLLTKDKKEIKKVSSLQNYLNFSNKRHSLNIDNEDIKNIKYNYCTEFIFKIKKDNFNLKNKQKEFSQNKIGDSLILIKKDNLLKIHIHTNKPGYILSDLLQYGSLIKSKIDNMQEQKKIFSKKKEQKFFLITITSDKNIRKIFKDLQVDYIINQENPTIKFFQKIIKQEEMNNLIILPNNEKTLKTILKLKKNNPVHNIKILETNNIGQVYNALLAYDPKLDFEVNLKNMNKNIKKNKIIQILDNIHDTNTKQKLDEEKKFVAIFEKEKNYDTNLLSLVQKLLKKIINNKSKFLTIFYKKNDFIKNNLKEIEFFLEKYYKNLEIEKIENEKTSNFLYIFLLDEY